MGLEFLGDLHHLDLEYRIEDAAQVLEPQVWDGSEVFLLGLEQEAAVVLLRKAHLEVAVEVVQEPLEDPVDHQMLDAVAWAHALQDLRAAREVVALVLSEVSVAVVGVPVVACQGEPRDLVSPTEEEYHRDLGTGVQAPEDPEAGPRARGHPAAPWVRAGLVQPWRGGPRDEVQEGAEANCRSEGLRSAGDGPGVFFARTSALGQGTRKS